MTLKPNKEYKAVITLTVPFVSKPTSWYRDLSNRHTCIHCKENETVKTDLRLIPFCDRCYNLMHTKHDGTKIQKSHYGIAKDYKDIQEGKVKIVPLDKVDTKVIDE